MFAGAAREAVFSQPEVIRLVQSGFIPVALKAGLVQNPGADAEGRLYREIARSRPAPQGIAVANSDGRVLAWALSFDAPTRVEDFLDRQAKRYAQSPDAAHPVAVERFHRYPGMTLPEVPDAGAPVPDALPHPKEKPCPATLRSPEGTLIARVVGRALDAGGKPLADTIRQEHYVEDRLEIPTAVQEGFVRAASDAGAERVAVPDPLARLLVSRAYLGQLDVNPSIGGGKSPICELWARRVRAGVYRIDGRSTLAGGEETGNDGRRWRHEVTLAWDGLVEIRDTRLLRISLLARGTEKLTWRNVHADQKGEEAVTHLPAGRAIDLDAGVRYGLRAEPVADAEVGDPEPATGGPPRTLRNRMERLGPAVQEYAKGGGDLRALQPELEKLQRCLERRDFEVAEQQAEKIEDLVKKK